MRLTDAERAFRDKQVVEMRQAGRKIKSIADDLGLSTSEVQRILGRAGLVRDRSTLTERNARILEAVAAGYTRAEIAQQLGTTVSVVCGVAWRGREQLGKPAWSKGNIRPLSPSEGAR